MKKAILMVLVLVSPLLGQDEMTVEDAIRLGLKNNYDIRIARNDARVAANNVGRATTPFLPKLDALANYGLADSEEESNSPNSLGNSDTENWSAQVSLNWTLFDGFKMFAERSRYRALARQGEYQTRSIIERTVVEISRSYYYLVSQEQLLEVARESVAISDDRLQKERVRNELGGASSTDLLNAQVAYNRDHSQLLDQELETQVARQNLNVLLGRHPSTPLTVSKHIELPVIKMTDSEALEQALENNSGLRLARQNKRVAESDVSIGRSSFMPKLALTGSYGYSDRDVMADAYAGTEISTQTTSTSVGLQLSLNIFNGMTDKINLQNARITAKNSELTLRDVENRLESTVQEAWRTLQQRMELSGLEAENVTAARQNLELQQDRYRLGATSSLEFRDAQVSLAQAQTILIRARYEARIAWLELQQLTGSLPLE